MKTLFDRSFAGTPFSPRRHLGQQPLSAADKSALYGQIVDTEGKLDVVNAWKRDHPNLDVDLGPDAAQFRDLENWMMEVQGIAQNVERLLESSDPAVVSSSDLVRVNEWIAYVHQMYVIVAGHKGKLPTAAPPPGQGMPPAPAKTTGVNPVVVGITAAGLLTLAIVAFK
jgi:hypothetical protein